MPPRCQLGRDLKTALAAILLDFHLHDGTALELLEQLGKIVDLATTPVVISTDSETDFVSQNVFRAGAVDLVHKDTVTPGGLCRTVRYAVERSRTHSLRSQLAQSQRSAILLVREKNLPYEDIARILEVSVSATKSLIHRGRETLKRRLKAYLRSGSWSPESEDRETFPPPRF